MKKKMALFTGIVVALIMATAAIITLAKGSEVETRGEESPNGYENPVEPAVDRTVAYLNKDASLSDIKKEAGVVNIYMFWGNGCPHCKSQWEYFEVMRKRYPKDFNVYGFEVWNNKGNLKLMNQFAEAMNDSVNAVPYLIIGNKTYKGVLREKYVVDAIKEAKQSGFDIYFDRIK